MIIKQSIGESLIELVNIVDKQNDLTSDLLSKLEDEMLNSPYRYNLDNRELIGKLLNSTQIPDWMLK